MNGFELLTSRRGGATALWLGRTLPAGLADWLCRQACRYLARQHDTPAVRALRTNMAVVHRLPPDDPRLDALVAQVLYHMGCGYRDLMRAVDGGRPALEKICRLGPQGRQLLASCLDGERGLVLVGAHLCGYDLLLCSLAPLLPSAQVLSKSNPTGGLRLMNELRLLQGVEVTPISTAALRQALRRLRAGGAVAIAADVPAGDGEELLFFGRPARMLVGHARLAAQTGARMLVGVTRRVEPGRYQVELARVPRPARQGDRSQDVRRWAQATLATLERMIAAAPDQWMMPEPVWPLAPASGAP